MKAAFIKLNTSEIREKLESLGFHFSGFGDIDNGEVITTSITVQICPDRIVPGCYSCLPMSSVLCTDPRLTWGTPYRIDCGTDIDLFLSYCV
jgi:hypothetical protein